MSSEACVLRPPTLGALGDGLGAAAATGAFLLSVAFRSVILWRESACWLLPTRISFRPLCACVHAKSLQSCPTLCDPRECSPPGNSVHGILLVRLLEWVAMPSSRGSSQPRDQTHVSCVSCIGRQFLYP